MKNRLKGCRPSKQVIQDFSNICAEYGAAQYRLTTLPIEIERLQSRLDDLQLELSAARIQEANLAKGEEPEFDASALDDAPEFKVAE